MKGKHFKEKNPVISKKFILILLVLIIVGFTIYEKFFCDKNIITTTDDNIYNETTKTEITNTPNSEITLHKTVENCDSLEITGLNITSQGGYYSIKTNIINNSNDILNNFVLNISIFDSNNNLITKLSNPVGSISPGESLQVYGVVKENLSNAYSYKVEKN